jgi:serine/threonine protein phosphatase PrpC
MAVLADGMGGHSGGAVAAEQVIVMARQGLAVFAPDAETARERLDEIMQDAHVAVTLTRFTSEKDPHATAVVFLLHGGRASWAHCGDSRLYHFRGKQTMSRTEDHSLIGELLRQGKITPAAAQYHPKRGALMSCLGGSHAPKVTHGGAGPLAAGDAFLLCSDGLWDYFSDAELAAIIDSNGAREAANRMVSLARERAEGSGDNLSLALVKVVETPA